MRELLRVADEQSISEYGEILEEYEGLGGYEVEANIEREIVEIGMKSSVLEQGFGTLSGGEQTRALIIALFLRRGVFPLIDEPTNHLDMQGRQLLGDYLSRKQGFILVSHDRFFLDQCADHILSINKADVRIHQATFSEWKLQMEREEETELRRSENLLREIRALKRSARQRRTWSDAKEKQKIGATAAHMDKGYISHKAAKQMKRALSTERRVDQGIVEKEMLLQNRERERALKLHLEKKSPDVVLFVENATIEIDRTVIVDNISILIRKGDRIALIGANGSGKTTLLNAISGEIALSAGAIYLPAYLNVIRAYQNPRWQQGLVTTHLSQAGIDESLFRSVMGSIGVSGEIFARPLESFSQGERKKVDLCRSFLQPAHLLLWDEPMNYIDFMSREQIEKVILKYQPTMLFAEHDRWFVDTVATDIVELP